MDAVTHAKPSTPVPQPPRHAPTPMAAGGADRLSRALVNLQETVERLKGEEAEAAAVNDSSADTPDSGVGAVGHVHYGEVLQQLEGNVRSLLELRNEFQAKAARPDESRQRELTKRMTVLMDQVAVDLTEIRKQREEHLHLARKIVALSPTEKEQYLSDLRRNKPAKMLQDAATASPAPVHTGSGTPVSPTAITPTTRSDFNLLAPSELPNPVMTGWLVKLGGEGFLRNWRRRYFVVSTGRVYYFKTPNDRECLHDINLDQASSAATTEFDMPFLFKLTSPHFDRVYYFSADSQDEQDAWLQVIQQQAGTVSSSPNSTSITINNNDIPGGINNNTNSAGGNMSTAKNDRSAGTVISTFTTLGRSLSNVFDRAISRQPPAEGVQTSIFFTTPPASVSASTPPVLAAPSSSSAATLSTSTPAAATPSPIVATATLLPTSGAMVPDLTDASVEAPTTTERTPLPPSATTVQLAAPPQRASDTWRQPLHESHWNLLESSASNLDADVDRTITTGCIPDEQMVSDKDAAVSLDHLIQTLDALYGE